MGYTREERLDIGKQIYNNEISKSDAAIKYSISEGLYEAVPGCERPAAKKQDSER